MCDTILMIDKDIDTIREDGKCLCWSSQEEVLTYIITHLPKIQYNTKIIIERHYAGWAVSIENAED